MSPFPVSPAGPQWKAMPVTRPFFYINFRVLSNGPPPSGSLHRVPILTDAPFTKPPFNYLSDFPVNVLPMILNPSARSDERCSSRQKHLLLWSDEHCSSCCTLSLILLYLDNIGRKCNRAALFVFMKELALLWCGRQFLQIIASFFSLLSNFGWFSFCIP